MTNEPRPLLLIMVIFALFMLVESLGYQAHMKPVLYFRAHQDLANRLLTVDCKTRAPGNAECLAAWEALSPIQQPVVYGLAEKLRAQKR